MFEARDLEVTKIYEEDGKQVAYEFKRSDGSLITVSQDKMKEMIRNNHNFKNSTMTLDFAVHPCVDVPRLNCDELKVLDIKPLMHLRQDCNRGIKLITKDRTYIITLRKKSTRTKANIFAVESKVISANKMNVLDSNDVALTRAVQQYARQKFLDTFHFIDNDIVTGVNSYGANREGLFLSYDTENPEQVMGAFLLKLNYLINCARQAETVSSDSYTYVHHNPITSLAVSVNTPKAEEFDAVASSDVIVGLKKDSILMDLCDYIEEKNESVLICNDVTLYETLIKYYVELCRIINFVELK